MAALSVRLAHPAWDLAIFLTAVVVGFASAARIPIVVTVIAAMGLLKWRLAHADRLRDAGIRPEGVGSKLNRLFSWLVLSWGATALIGLSLHP